MTDMTLQIAELEIRVSELSTALERVTTERDHYKDAAESLFKELEACKLTLKQCLSDISRLRTYLAQGVEL